MGLVVPNNAMDIMVSLKELLNDNVDLGGSNVPIAIAEEIEASPTDTGWIGIYRDRVTYEPRTIGVASGFMTQKLRLMVLVQCASLAGGEDCAARLEELLQSVLKSVLSDTSLRGAVQGLDGAVDISYDRYDKDGNDFIQRAIIYLTTIGLVNVSF